MLIFTHRYHEIETTLCVLVFCKDHGYVVLQANGASPSRDL